MHIYCREAIDCSAAGERLRAGSAICHLPDVVDVSQHATIWGNANIGKGSYLQVRRRSGRVLEVIEARSFYPSGDLRTIFNVGVNFFAKSKE